jgi:hypothetical protein
MWPFMRSVLFIVVFAQEICTSLMYIKWQLGTENSDLKEKERVVKDTRHVLTAEQKTNEGSVIR